MEIPATLDDYLKYMGFSSPRELSAYINELEHALNHVRVCGECRNCQWLAAKVLAERKKS